MKARKYIVAFSRKGYLPGKALFFNNFKLLIESWKPIDETNAIIAFRTGHSFFWNDVLISEKGEVQLTVRFPLFKDLSEKKVEQLSFFLQNGDYLRLIIAVVSWEKEINLQPYFSFFRFSPESLEELLKELEVSGKVKVFDFVNYPALSSDFLQNQFQKLRNFVQQEKEKKTGIIKVERIARKIGFQLSMRPLLFLLKKLSREEEFTLVENNLYLSSNNFRGKEEEILARITALLKQEKLVIFSFDHLKKIAGGGDDELMQGIFHLWNEQQIIQINPYFFILRGDFEKFVNRLKKHKRNNSDLISIQEMKELTGLSRKYLIPLLEFFDQQKITQRLGNKRRILISV